MEQGKNSAAVISPEPELACILNRLEVLLRRAENVTNRLQGKIDLLTSDGEKEESAVNDLPKQGPLTICGQFNELLDGLRLTVARMERQLNTLDKVV